MDLLLVIIDKVYLSVKYIWGGYHIFYSKYFLRKYSGLRYFQYLQIIGKRKTDIVIARGELLLMMSVETVIQNQMRNLSHCLKIE